MSVYSQTQNLLTRMPLLLLLLSLLFLPAGFSQTLVPEGTNDTFHLSCPACRMRVDGVSLTYGQHALPMNTQKPVSLNLLLWRYYDNILSKHAYMAHEPFWTKGTQLIEEVPDDAVLSLHINLVWTDSTGRDHRIYLLMAGITRRHLAQSPLITVCDADTYAPLRLVASAQIFRKDDEWETFEAIDGIATLEEFNIKTGALKGSFEFLAQRVGMEKKGLFQSGVFQR